MRFLFNSFKSVVESRRPVRRQKLRLQKLLESQAINNTKKKYAIKKLKELVKFKKMLNNPLPRLMRLRRCFEAWHDKLEWLKLSKVNYLIQKEFSLQTLGRKALRVLRDYKEQQQNN